MTKGFEKAAQVLDFAPQTAQLIGGEDYGLLFTMDPKKTETLVADFETEFGEKILILGEMKPGAGLNFLENGLSRELIWKPFSHFGER
jgi:thiamine monophosphate kinase